MEIHSHTRLLGSGGGVSAQAAGEAASATHSPPRVTHPECALEGSCHPNEQTSLA